MAIKRAEQPGAFCSSKGRSHYSNQQSTAELVVRQGFSSSRGQILLRRGCPILCYCYTDGAGNQSPGFALESQPANTYGVSHFESLLNPMFNTHNASTLLTAFMQPMPPESVSKSPSPFSPSLFLPRALRWMGFTRIVAPLVRGRCRSSVCYKGTLAAYSIRYLSLSGTLSERGLNATFVAWGLLACYCSGILGTWWFRGGVGPRRLRRNAGYSLTRR